MACDAHPCTTMLTIRMGQGGALAASVGSVHTTFGHRSIVTLQERSGI